MIGQSNKFVLFLYTDEVATLAIQYETPLDIG